MIRVVIDTNCLIPAIPANSSYKWLYDAFIDELFEWVVSTEILAEYAEKITDFFSKATADFVLKSLDNAPNVLLAEPYFRWRFITDDPDDDKFADLALSLGADYLVTNDRHFDMLREIDFPAVQVITLQAFQTVIIALTKP